MDFAGNQFELAPRVYNMLNACKSVHNNCIQKVKTYVMSPYIFGFFLDTLYTSPNTVLFQLGVSTTPLPGWCKENHIITHRTLRATVGEKLSDEYIYSLQPQTSHKIFCDLCGWLFLDCCHMQRTDLKCFRVSKEWKSVV